MPSFSAGLSSMTSVSGVHQSPASFWWDSSWQPSQFLPERGRGNRPVVWMRKGIWGFDLLQCSVNASGVNCLLISSFFCAAWCLQSLNLPRVCGRCWLLSTRHSQKFSEFSNLNSQKAQIYVSYHLPMTHLLFCLFLFSLFLSCGSFGEIRYVFNLTFNLMSAVLLPSNHWPFGQSTFSSPYFTLPSIPLPHSSGCGLSPTGLCRG